MFYQLGGVDGKKKRREKVMTKSRREKWKKRNLCVRLDVSVVAWRQNMIPFERAKFRLFFEFDRYLVRQSQ